MPISSFYYYIRAGQIIPSIPSHSRVSRRRQILSPNPIPLFNSSSPATVQKPVNFISHICGLGASVGCERVERTFNAPRLKSQICLIGDNGFVCSVSNELNSKPHLLLASWILCEIRLISFYLFSPPARILR